MNPKELDEKIQSEITSNTERLNGCSLPHNFEPQRESKYPGANSRPNSAAICSKCGGVVRQCSAELYNLGINHALNQAEILFEGTQDQPAIQLAYAGQKEPFGDRLVKAIRYLVPEGKRRLLFTGDKIGVNLVSFPMSPNIIRKAFIHVVDTRLMMTFFVGKGVQEHVTLVEGADKIQLESPEFRELMRQEVAQVLKLDKEGRDYSGSLWTIKFLTPEQFQAAESEDKFSSCEITDTE